VPTYPTSGQSTTTPYPPTSSTVAYSRDVFGQPPSLPTDTAVTVTSSSLPVSTTSSVTSYLSGPFAVGADMFGVQRTSSVHVATASTLSSATVTLGVDPPKQNFVVPGADAAQSFSTFPVGVKVPDVPSTTTASTFGTATPSTSAAAVSQSTTPTRVRSPSGPGLPGLWNPGLPHCLPSPGLRSSQLLSLSRRGRKRDATQHWMLRLRTLWLS